MNRILTRASIRVLAIFVLVLGVAAGAWLGLGHRAGGTGGPAGATASPVAQAGDPAADQNDRHQQVDGERQREMREAAGRSASRDAQEKAAEAARKAAADASAADKAGSPSPSPSSSAGGSVGPIPSSCQQYSGNQATGCALLLQGGFGLDQMPCLVNLWNRESSWNTHAQNPSGAYGIPQALPGDKMAAYGPNWQDDAATQIKWGLSYIQSRYSTPCAAWQHSQATNWY